MSDNILELRGICKSFPGVKALDDVSFNIQRGTVHALVGENGAGKSTLIKVLAGIYQPEKGEIDFDGKKRSCFKTPSESQAAGISVVHQEIKLSETLSVAENVFLGKWLYKNGLIDWKRMRVEADKLLTQLGLSLNVEEIVSNLSVAQKQMVEICKAINRNCRLLIMDEPSATLTEKEQKVMFETVKRLRTQGMTIIYISHRLDEIFDLADNVTVLRDGKHIRTMAVQDVTRHDLVTMMVGREVVNEYPKAEVPIGEVVLEARHIVRKGVLNDISFSLRRGEILGIAGLVGAGRTELAKTLYGLFPWERGKVMLNGKPYSAESPSDAIRQGLFYMTEDRKRNGLVMLMDVGKNITLSSLDKIRRGVSLDEKAEKRIVADYIEKINIKTPSMYQQARNLSGGNQQKVVLAKWMFNLPDVLILDEPTRGIDVGAKYDIYCIINKLAASGKCVLVISSELPELLGVCDRIYVMNEGEIKGEKLVQDATQENIMRLLI